MSSKFLALVIVGAAPLVLACNISGTAPASADITRLCFASADGERVQSTLITTRSRALDHLVGVTALDSGARLVEDVTIDGRGWLVSASARLELRDGTPPTRVMLDPARGSVKVTAPNLHLEWAVPNDLPWVWAPLLTEPSTGAPIATPLDAQVAFRAVAEGHAVRQLDLGALTSQTVTGDQVLVSDGAQAIVVLGNDAIEFERGLPKRLRLAALGANLEPVDTRKHSGVLAAVVGCQAANGFFVP